MLVPTVDDLLLLPYGGESIDEPLSVDQLLALDYTGGPAFSRGLTAQSYRERMQANGERIQWLRSIKSDTARDGHTYVTISLDEGVRVFIYSNQNDIENEEWGTIAKGETMLSWMPDEMQPQRDDRFVAIDRTADTSLVLQPSNEVTRALKHSYVVSILAVYENGAKVSPVNYALGSGAIIWTNGYHPVVAVEVFYTHLRVYEFLAEKQMQGPRGQDGVRLPSRAPLRLLPEG